MVVVPTPPLAPMNAKIWPCTLDGRAELTRSTAAFTSTALSGSETHSVTPARIASSISPGSIRAATIMTPVVGC
jgi:hypothetical protein